jgi:xanthine dehydrogenase accessory factor
MKDIYDEIQRLMANNESAALATLISISGSTPRGQGAKMLVRQDGSIVGTVGGSLLEGNVREEARNVIADGKSKILDFDLTGKEAGGMICGGVAKVYIEPIVPMPTLFVFGGGHISYFLSRIGKIVGFRVVVIDDRKEYANPVRFPEADETLADAYEAVFPRLKIDDFAYIIIVTRGHAFDQTVLEWAVTTDARYIGMIGSKIKIKRIYNNLTEKGVSQDKLDQVYAPIGLDIHSETPEEIAVSILSEIIKVFRPEKIKGKSTCQG